MKPEDTIYHDCEMGMGEEKEEKRLGHVLTNRYFNGISPDVKCSNWYCRECGIIVVGDSKDFQAHLETHYPSGFEEKWLIESNYFGE